MANEMFFMFNKISFFFKLIFTSKYCNRQYQKWKYIYKYIFSLLDFQPILSEENTFQIEYQ